MSQGRDRRRERPQIAVEVASAQPLELRVRFPAGAILQPRSSPRLDGAADCACPYCGYGDVTLTSDRSLPTGGRAYYYRCNVCVDRTTHDYSRFKRLRLEMPDRRPEMPDRRPEMPDRG